MNVHKADATRSPYFLDGYHAAEVLTFRGRKMPGIQAKVNLYTNAVQIISNGVEVVLPMGGVKDVVLYDTTAAGPQRYLLRAGFPAIYGKTREQFYLVLTEGKCSLLELIEKKAIERKDAINYNEIYYEYEDHISYYLFVNEQLRPLKMEAAYLLEVLGDKKEELSKQFHTKNLKLAEVTELIKLYNSL